MLTTAGATARTAVTTGVMRTSRPAAAKTESGVQQSSSQHKAHGPRRPMSSLLRGRIAKKAGGAPVN
jgi:hypothetical protein